MTGTGFWFRHCWQRACNTSDGANWVYLCFACWCVVHPCQIASRVPNANMNTLFLLFILFADYMSRYLFRKHSQGYIDLQSLVEMPVSSSPSCTVCTAAAVIIYPLLSVLLEWLSTTILSCCCVSYFDGPQGLDLMHSAVKSWWHVAATSCSW